MAAIAGRGGGSGKRWAHQDPEALERMRAAAIVEEAVVADVLKATRQAMEQTAPQELDAPRPRTFP